MCSPATTSIWRLAIHPSAKLVLLALDHFSSPHPAALCELGQAALAAACGLVPRQLRRVLGDLRELGHIEIITRRDGKGRQIANAYRITTAKSPEDMGVRQTTSPEDVDVLWTKNPEDVDVLRTGFSIHKEIDGGDKPTHLWIGQSSDPEDMGVRRWSQPEDMGVLRAETDPEYFYGETRDLTSGGHGCPTDPEDMGVRPSLSLKEVREVTATSLQENKKKGDRESGVCDSVGPRQKPRFPSATLSNPPGFDWRGIAEEIRPDLHQLDHVWAKFTVYQQGKCVSVFQHEKNWRLWLMRERKDSAPRPERPAVRHAPGAFIASLPRQPIHGHCEVIHEHI